MARPSIDAIGPGLGEGSLNESGTESVSEANNGVLLAGNVNIEVLNAMRRARSDRSP